jgi:biopolymer transport protein TolR
MGMSTGGNKGGVHSDINVTPLIDVLLVLLIIFLVVMPIMMKMEALEVPRKLTDQEVVSKDAIQLTVIVKANHELVLKENDKQATVPTMAELLRQLRPRLEAAALVGGGDKVVFVDFDQTLPWGEVISTMDSVRSLAQDVNHDAVKVALKIKPKKGEPGAEDDSSGQ